MNKIAAALEPAFVVAFDEESTLDWGEPYHPFAAQGYPQQRNREAKAGDPGEFRCQLTLSENPDQSQTYHFTRPLVEARGLPAETSVSLIINDYGRHSISVRSPIEKQAAVLRAIQECLPAKRT